MPGLVINGKEVQVAGLNIRNWNDDPFLRRSPEDGKARKNPWIRQVILHTTKGIPGGDDHRPQIVKPGSGGDQKKDVAVAKFWSGSKLQSGAHLIIDTDGSVGCIADLATEHMFHAGIVNGSSIGIEIYQDQDAGIFQASLDTAVVLCNALSEIFGIQRQVHLPYLRGPVDRLEKGGDDCVGFFGHRDVTNNRGQGDPGDFIMNALVSAGYEKFNFEKNEDIQAWKIRQASLNESGQKVDVDGIPGPATWAALKNAGYVKGLWVLGKPLPDKTNPSVDAPASAPTETKSGDTVVDLKLTSEEIFVLKELVKVLNDTYKKIK